MSELFRPVDVGPVTARNRVWVSPMCQYSVDQRDGTPTGWHAGHLESFARGGAGLVMTEATAVEPIGRISPWDTGIWSADQSRAWAPIAASIAAHGAVPAIQLAHAGRKASAWRPWDAPGSVPEPEGGWQTVGAGDAPFADHAPPRALATDEVAGIPALFARAATFAVDAGFRAVEVHAAHGYLIHQFLSPITNRRDDEWGDPGLLLERVVLAVRDATRGSDTALVVRLSATDWVPGGITVDDTVRTAQRAVSAGADWLDVSSGGLDPRQQITVAPGYQVPFARAVRAGAGVPVNAVGLITEPAQAEQILVDGDADAVMLGRAMLRNPYWALLAETALDGVPEHSVWPRQYDRARPR